MNLDDELAELLARLGVAFEESPRETLPRARNAPRADHAAPRDAAVSPLGAEGVADDMEDDAYAEAELSLFQTSREHYGVFYRLDLIAGVPELRIFAPADAGASKMRCYLVRAASGSPVRAWFALTRAHAGSAAFDDARETTEQHLLFAAGETMKRLFWAGDPAPMRFPPEIEVTRVLV